jgi:hypothetical protein
VTDPVAVLLKFAFIGVLYLFLLWVARSALRDLRRPAAARSHPAASLLQRSIIVAQGGGGLSRGAAFEVDGALTIGRSPQMDVQIDDGFASGRHARIYERDGYAYVEDLGSTNGTYLNGRRLDGAEALDADDTIRVGNTEFRYEQRE